MFEEIAGSIARRLFGDGNDNINNERNNNRRHDRAARENRNDDTNNERNHNRCNDRTAEKILRILEEQVGGDFNLYPSDHKGDCCNKAFFLAIREAFPSGTRITVNGAFKYAIEQFIQHMIDCGNITKNACIITESWDPKMFTYWEDAIRGLCTQYVATLEIYLIANGGEHKIIQINP